MIEEGDRSMSSADKILIEVFCGIKDKIIRFVELQKLLECLGFECRIKGGDHFIYYSTFPPVNLV